jgi:uncharacterized protein YciI
MMDEEFVERRPGDLEVYRRLDAFAQLRLAPDAAAMARIRSLLVAQATSLVAAQVAVAAVPAEPTRLANERRWGTRPRLGRAAGALLAAALTLGLVAGSVAASQPGGPLYGSRLWVENMLLPGGPNARADAQVARLDDRLAEVRAALASGDSGATSAALEAYASILADLEAQAAADPAVADRVRDDVLRHLAVLEALIGHVPPQAQEALRHALDRSDSALDHLGGAGSGRPPGAPGANGGGSAGSGGSGGNPDRTPAGNPPTKKPAKTAPKPEATVKPTKAPAKTPPAAEPSKKPAATAAPDPTGGPGRTPQGPQGSRRGS